MLSTPPELVCALPVMVCGFGGELEFAVGLIEEVLGLGGVTIHIPLVGLLSGADFVPCLLTEALRSGDVGMACRVDVVFRHLGSQNAADHECSGECETAEHGLLLHSVLRQTSELRDDGRAGSVGEAMM